MERLANTGINDNQLHSRTQVSHSLNFKWKDARKPQYNLVRKFARSLQKGSRRCKGTSRRILNEEGDRASKDNNA